MMTSAEIEELFYGNLVVCQGKQFKTGHKLYWFKYILFVPVFGWGGGDLLGYFKRRAGQPRYKTEIYLIKCNKGQTIKMISPTHILRLATPAEIVGWKQTGDDNVYST